jgi:uncharacterized membrane protein AbrB (regulator of aidB expression)
MTRSMQARLLTDVIAAVVCTAGAAVILADVTSPLRAGIILIGLVLGTGWSLVGWIPLPRDAAYVGAVLLGVGFAVPIVVSVVMVEAGWWHPIGTVVVLLCAAAVLCAALTVRDLRAGRHPRAGRGSRADTYVPTGSVR